MNDAPPTRDHLFISYATEQTALAEWLTLQLTAEGYAVWCDKVKLLGGESYPRDIDHAIKERSFRVVALLSKEAVEKANPTKERTLALNLGRERKIDFLIPLNATGLAPTELDWMTSDLTYIPFHRGWAPGFRQLLEKLDSIQTPKILSDGKAKVVSWYNARTSLPAGSETLWTNVLGFEGVPPVVYRLRAETGRSQETWPSSWVSHWAAPDPATGWCLELPKSGLPDGMMVSEVVWDLETPEGIHALDVTTTLLRKHLEGYVVRNGMRYEEPIAYFPSGLLADEKIRYTNTRGRSIPIKVTGQRNFRTITGGRDTVNYHLGFAAHPDYRTFGKWMLQVHPRIVLRDTSDQPLEPKLANRRRKAMCRMWFNHQWGTRFKALAEWLAPLEAPTLLSTEGALDLRLVGSPIEMSAAFTIDETGVVEVVEDERVDIDDRDAEEPGALEDAQE